MVFFCKAGVRSSAAAQIARQGGYTNVGEYRGSWADWERRGGMGTKGPGQAVGKEDAAPQGGEIPGTVDGTNTDIRERNPPDMPSDPNRKPRAAPGFDGNDSGKFNL